jgi:hypothetical protein
MPTSRLERERTQFAAISTSSSGDNTIVAAVTGQKIKVLNYVVTNSVATAQAVTWKSGASTSLSGAMGLPSSIGGGIAMAGTGGEVPSLATAAGQALVLNLSAATAVAGHIAYIVE